MTHVEVLNVMRDFYDGSVLEHPEKVAALTAAIAALEAVEGGKRAECVWCFDTMRGIARGCDDCGGSGQLIAIPASVLEGGK